MASPSPQCGEGFCRVCISMTLPFAYVYNRRMENEAEEALAANTIDTRAAFADGAEFAGDFMQITGAAILAILAVIVFYIVMRQRQRRIVSRETH